MSFGITTSASSILKACGRCRSRTGLTDIGAPHRSFSHDIHNRPYVRLFRTVNIMNRHVVTVNCCMILQESTLIDTLWTYMGFTILSQSTTFFHNIGRSHNDLKFPKVVRSLIQDCGKQGIRTPVTFWLTCLANRCDKPLCQLSIFPCSEEHGIILFYIIYVEHQLNDDLKVILTTLIYLYKFIMIEAF